MNDTTNRGAIITREYRKRLEHTYRSFAEALTEGLMSTTVSQTSVQNWETGVTEPKMEFLWVVLVNYTDWRADWAVDMLCATLPDAFEVIIDKKMDHYLQVLAERVIVSRRKKNTGALTEAK